MKIIIRVAVGTPHSTAHFLRHLANHILNKDAIVSGHFAPDSKHPKGSWTVMNEPDRKEEL